MTGRKKIVYFDGVCNLCNWSVRFIIKHDKEKHFSFASLQSDFAKKRLSHVNGQDIKWDSVIYQEQDTIMIKSDAALGIVRHLDGAWKWLVIFKILPLKWRDRLYELVAANRYRWFGRTDQCMIPNPEIQSRFLD
jgi:predicted DCC family thiol-disulfide oxidoreductase YuxK